MKTTTLLVIVSLILLPSVTFACGQDCGRLDVSDVACGSASIVPGTASIIVDGMKSLSRMVTTIGPDLPCHLAHAPEMAVNAGGDGAIRARMTACEGMNGFSSLSNFFLRIAYSSFSALVSGILRF